MAFSTCPHCKHRYFQLAETEPAGSRVKLYFVQCSKCGAPCGVTEFYSAGSLLKEQEKAIGDLASRIGRIEYAINQIVHALNSR